MSRIWERAKKGSWGLLLGGAILWAAGCGVGDGGRQTGAQTPESGSPALPTAVGRPTAEGAPVMTAAPASAAAGTAEPSPAVPRVLGSGDTRLTPVAAVGAEPIGAESQAAVAGGSALPTLSVTAEPRRHGHGDCNTDFQVTVYVLDPGAENPGEDGGFHNWRVLSQMPVQRAEDRKQLLYAAVRGCRPCAAPAHWNTTVAGGNLDLPAAFTPARGLRVLREGRTWDYLISQDGTRVQVYENGSFARESAAPADLSALCDSLLTGGTTAAGDER